MYLLKLVEGKRNDSISQENNMTSKDNTKCPNCGSLYKITKYRLLSRDIDKIDCVVCGVELLKWNGAVAYDAELLQRSDWLNKED